MKKPLLVILIIGSVPILLLVIGLLSTKKVGDTQTDNYFYPQTTDNAFLDADASKAKLLQFFSMAGKDIGVIDLFKDQTIDQLRYDNIYQTSLTVALENIVSIQLINSAPFETESWTNQDHMYLVSYQIELSEKTYSFLGSSGTNEKIFLLVNTGNQWKIADITDAPSF